MRLTLRTLLAYLDNTLEPADRRDLDEKVKGSSLATALTEKIRSVISAADLTPPVPDATNPNEDANTVAAYVDSTLSPELTADLERHCLESEAHLAEVAACHQILAFAEQGGLKEISPKLRERIVALPGNTPPDMNRPEHSLPSAALPPNVSVAAQTAPTEAKVNAGAKKDGVPSNNLPSEIAMPQNSVLAKSHTPPREPVPDLTATIAAATKVIREKHIADKLEPFGSTPPVAQAGVKSRRQLEELGPILSGGRPSRVAPLLVAFALCAVFCFVLIQAIQPLLRLKNKDVATSSNTSASVEIATPTVDLLPNRLDGPQSNSSDSGESKTPSRVSKPSLTPPPSPEQATGETPSPLQGSTESPSAQTLNTQETSGAQTTDPATSVLPTEPSASESPTSPSPVDTPDSQPQSPLPNQRSPQTASNSSAPDSVDPASILDRAEAKDAAISTPPSPMSIAPPRILGGIEDDGGLLLTQDTATGQWLALPTKTSLVAGQVIACPPSFRARMMLDGGAEVTLIGPCALRLNRVGSGASDDPQRLFFTIDFGRLLIMATQRPIQFSLATPSTSGRATLLAPGAVAAVSVEYQRAPGEDPLGLATSKCVTTLFAVQNQCGWQPNNSAVPGDGNSVSQGSSVLLSNGNRWTISSASPGIVDRGTDLPPWTAANDLISTPEDIATRNRLVEFIATDNPLEVSLREAIGFRESDVGALAAMTLLSLGMPDAYFGPAGILSQPQQRIHWPKLVDALQAFFDRGPPSAAMVGAAAEQGSGPEVAGKIWGLLGGFPPQSLTQGADKLLVEMMDDPDIAVRVVATEIAKQMTGLDIDYHPEYETTARRSQGLKRWQASQRRGQIVWQDPIAATAGRPRW